ncbi:sodium:solute symporter family protein [Paraglaciecola arctica]|uniref:sodium:solute symporter family protein n=1 Tax=Paraglaciecola arctica TaxID=1128911 RepID=UPI001C074BB3|nr:Na+:solute symporter [Paraglaciecola arctica]
MSQFDIAIAIAFSALVFILGLSFSRSGKNVKSFFAAGGAVPWWISGLSLFMSFFSVGTFVIWGAIAYNNGLVAVTIQTTMSIAGFIVGFYIAPKWNRTKALTAAEFITQRLGAKTQKFYTLIFLFISIFGSGAFLYPVGKMLEVTAGVPLSTAIVVLGCLIILYTAVGGLWAVLVTDVLQFVVLVAAVLIVVPLAFDQVNGVSGFIEQSPEGFFALTNAEYAPWFMFAFGFYNMVFIGGSWAYVQRYTSVASPRDAKKVGFLFGSLYLVAPMIWMLPPMIYRIMQPDLSSTEAEGAYLMISQQVVPDGVMGLILGAMVFATASSVNTTLNIASGVFTNDIYRVFRTNTSVAETMRVARFSTLVFGLIATGVALMVQNMGGIVEVVFSLAAITGAALFLPPIWSLFSKAQTGKSVVITTVLSLLVNGFFKFVSPAMFDFELERSPEMLVGVLVPFILLSLFELRFVLAKKDNPQYIDYINSRVDNTTFENQDHSDDEQNLYGRKIIATGIAMIGLFVLGLGWMADYAQGVLATVGIAILMLAWLVKPKATQQTTINEEG